MKDLDLLHKILVGICLSFPIQSTAQDINITGLVVNSNQQPVANVKVYLSGSPEIICLTDQNGKFTLTDIVSAIPELFTEDLPVSMMPDGSLEFNARNRSFSMTIFDIMGRATGPAINEKKLNGTYIIYPKAYIQNLPEGIYIARVILGNQQRGFKINNFNRIIAEKGLIQIGYDENDNTLVKKNTAKNEDKPAGKNIVSSEDTLIFEHDFYKTTLLEVPGYILNVGTVELENFGDYSPAVGIEPDKIKYNKQYGNFVKVYGQDSSRFILSIDPYATLERELNIRAIPVKKFEFLSSSNKFGSGNSLDPAFKFISGIHLEPTGTHFYFPVQVNIGLNKVDNPDSLVVILHNDETGKICYVPFFVHEPYLKNINVCFSISHFSDIVIGKGVIPAISGITYKNSDDAISEVAFLYNLAQLNHEVPDIPDDLFTKWYNEVIKYDIASIFDMESLQFAIQDLILLSENANKAGKFVEQLSFYSEAIDSLNGKFKYLFNLLKDECSSLCETCQCQKRDLALIAAQLNIIAQKFQGINQLEFSELCKGEVLNLVNKIDILQPVYSLKPGESTQIQYSAENILNQQISAIIEWYSDDPFVVQVNSVGKITAIKKGQAIVHAKYCDVENFVQVNVGDLTQSPCSTLPRPIRGTHNSRILIHGYNKNDITGSILELRKTIDITLIFTEDGNNNKYFGKYFEAWYHVMTAFATGGYHITDVSYENYTWNIQTYKIGYLSCSQYGYYTASQPHGADQILIYPNSRTVKAIDHYFNKVIMGIGTF